MVIVLGCPYALHHFFSKSESWTIYYYMSILISLEVFQLTVSSLYRLIFHILIGLRNEKKITEAHFGGVLLSLLLCFCLIFILITNFYFLYRHSVIWWIWFFLSVLCFLHNGWIGLPIRISLHNSIIFEVKNLSMAFNWTISSAFPFISYHSPDTFSFSISMAADPFAPICLCFIFIQS